MMCSRILERPVRVSTAANAQADEMNDPRLLLAAKSRRIWALTLKETRQVFRDPSSIAIGVVLPVILILLFGYALSLDVTDVPVAIVLEDHSPQAAELAAGFRLSPYFKPTFPG